MRRYRNMHRAVLLKMMAPNRDSVLFLLDGKGLVNVQQCAITDPNVMHRRKTRERVKFFGCENFRRNAFEMRDQPQLGWRVDTSSTMRACGIYFNFGFCIHRGADVCQSCDSWL